MAAAEEGVWKDKLPLLLEMMRLLCVLHRGHEFMNKLKLFQITRIPTPSHWPSDNSRCSMLWLFSIAS